MSGQERPPLPARPRRHTEGLWRGWQTGDEGAARSVTSTRLPTTAGVQSRLFPKTRSWFALGAPLELMSPLSIARVIFALDALVWLTAGAAWHQGSVAVPLSAGAGAAAVWLWMLRSRQLGPSQCMVLAVLAVADAAVCLWATTAAASVVEFTALAAPVGLFSALFLRGRTVAAVQVCGAAVLMARWAGLHSASQAVAVALLWLVGTGSAVAAILLLVRTVQRQGRTDADTGLPNGFGLAQLVRARPGWDTYLVASIALEGIGDAREALGYRVGTELVRRAVEDIGQVLPADALVGRVVADELVVVHRVGRDAAAAGAGGGDGAGDGTTKAGGGDGTASAVGGGPLTTTAAGGADGTAPVAVTEAAELTAAGLARAIASGRYVADGVEVSLRASVGLALAPWDGTDVEELVRKASLSTPRAGGHGQPVRRWRGSAGSLTSVDLAMLADLRVAAQQGELALHYQPQISLARGRTVSTEALLRWTSPTHGRVPPDRFIVLAERTGLVDRLTEWVVGEALDAQVRWRAAGLDVPVSVNLSGRSLTRPDLAAWILEQLSSRALPARALSVEITETAAPEDLAAAVELLAPLHEQGVRVSIDDFGVGYTSLSVLPRLALDELKVDKGFVMRALASPTDEAIVRTVCELGRRLGLDVVAEGVEDAEVCRLVADAGYDLVQGFHFARPMPERELVDFVTVPTSPPGPGRKALAL